MDRKIIVEAKRVQDDGPISDWHETHPSYGQISVSRMSSNVGMNLFGSPIKHNEIVSLRVMDCEAVRSLNSTRYHAHGQLIEIFLSPVQFADMITQMNTTGVPCTLSWIRGQGDMPDCPEEKPTEIMQMEFDKSMADAKAEILGLQKEVESILIETKISKVIKSKVMEVVGRLHRKLIDHYPFMAKQFARQMNKTAAVAKSEVDTYINGRITETGMKELGMKLPERRIEGNHQITPVDELKQKLQERIDK